MRFPGHPFSRWLLGAVALAASAAACDSVLDIEEPKARPETSGAGKPGAAGADGVTPEGGEPGVGGAGPAAGAGNGGEAGAPLPPECEGSEQRCGGGGDSGKIPEICENGRWVQNTDEAPGDCAVICKAGKCLECEGDVKRCAACPEGDATCSTNQPQTCVDGFWKNAGKECAQFCQAGDCVTAPSCAADQGSRTTCRDESCCRSLLVPGGTFKRNYDGEMYAVATFPAEVSPYLLDKYEVTIGRMRRFVEAYDEILPQLKDGAGKSQHLEGDKGWDSTFNAKLPPTKEDLVAELTCLGSTWSDDGAERQDLPVNCATYAVAYAFCISDGGRLPSDLELNFAASGGDEQRSYPWPAPDSGPPGSRAYANYDDSVSTVEVAVVGSFPKGDARWGQADLGGNVAEWVLDYFRPTKDDPKTCENCLNTALSPTRVVRGGAFNTGLSALLNGYRSSLAPEVKTSTVGFRCARDM